MSGTVTKIDMNSEEFKVALEKTVKFTDKVLKQFNFVYNPDAEVNEGVQMGLARNKLMHGKRYCPCFFVTGNKEEDRICPCPPALELEIPKDGKCHCGIFCTPEYAIAQKAEEELEAVSHEHSRGLTKDEANMLISKANIDSDELMSLLEARELGMVKFKLVDVREHMEYQNGHILGVDALVPTSSFYATLDEVNLDTDESMILYCHVGGRSAQCQMILKDRGFKNVVNLAHGIAGYHGEVVR
ncbi:MAG: sulfurtransferase [Helicobacteraceae bacterium]|nr:sulfurtransferase [Helicobacteraceae bacterium]